MELYDVAISFDTTGSMYSCIDNVKRNMSDMMRRLKADIPGIQLAVIAHGDYDTDHTYIIKYENFTNDVDRLCRFVQSAEGTGGGRMGNADEAYELSLNYCRRYLSWRTNANRIVIMIGDCRPHERDYSLNRQHIDWKDEMELLREMNVKIQAIQCERRSYADSFYHTIASETFGHHVELTDFSQATKVLMNVCYREAGLQNLASGSTPVYTESVVQSGIGGSSTFADSSANTTPTSIPPDSSDDSDTDDEQLVHNCVCFHPSCAIDVDPGCQTMNLYQAVLDRMFVDYGKVLEQNRLASRPEGDAIGVSTINGDTEWFTYRPNMTISALKSAIEVRLKLRPEQQKLIFNDESLKRNSNLSECGIKPYDTISLILPLYCVPEELDHVIFDLNWEFPAINPDFLDATCMTFERDKFIQVIDWNHPKNDYFLKGSIQHSEKNMTGPGSKTGHQIIHVHLKKVPANITHLYFILSSWKSPDLSSFKNPNLKFFDAADENVNLCETTFAHALSSQAVIMCSVVRTGRYWQIFECHGTSGLVNGNSKRYNPIRKKIVDLIKEDL